MPTSTPRQRPKLTYNPPIPASKTPTSTKMCGEASVGLRKWSDVTRKVSEKLSTHCLDEAYGPASRDAFWQAQETQSQRSHW
ncbi:hypothetical protein JADG_004972 [Aureobasidium aubasidani]|nr:hypothetical protein JADG_004970 [Aureobasidium pullulans]KAG2165233.1 hypothetical protein JADG_004972 [Aureobasidium pullulans]